MCCRRCEVLAHPREAPAPQQAARAPRSITCTISPAIPAAGQAPGYQLEQSPWTPAALGLPSALARPPATCACLLRRVDQRLQGHRTRAPGPPVAVFSSSGCWGATALDTLLETGISMTTQLPTGKWVVQKLINSIVNFTLEEMAAKLCSYENNYYTIVKQKNLVVSFNRQV